MIVVPAGRVPSAKPSAGPATSVYGSAIEPAVSFRKSRIVSPAGIGRPVLIQVTSRSTTVPPGAGQPGSIEADVPPAPTPTTRKMKGEAARLVVDGTTSSPTTYRCRDDHEAERKRTTVRPSSAIIGRGVELSSIGICQNLFGAGVLQAG